MGSLGSLVRALEALASFLAFLASRRAVKPARRTPRARAQAQEAEMESRRSYIFFSLTRQRVAGGRASSKWAPGQMFKAVAMCGRSCTIREAPTHLAGDGSSNVETLAQLSSSGEGNRVKVAVGKNVTSRRSVVLYPADVAEVNLPGRRLVGEPVWGKSVCAGVATSSDSTSTCRTMAPYLWC